MLDSDSRIICLMGPTASGKTQLAMSLCDRFPCEIISVDSVQVYCGLDIGTAKISLQDQIKYPHHLLDICSPEKPYSVANFKSDAMQLIQDIWRRNRIPLLVGGSMLYFHALINGLSILPSADQTVRNDINNMANDSKGWVAVHEYLAKVDPVSAARIHPHDKQRLQRALEVYLISGQSLTSLQKNINIVEPYHALNIVLMPALRSVLHEQIAIRCQRMLECGLVNEVESLCRSGLLSLATPAMRSVGYRQVLEYLEGTLCQSKLLERCIIATRQLAKRQLTWLRNWPEPCFYLVSFSTGWISEAMQQTDRWIENKK